MEDFMIRPHGAKQFRLFHAVLTLHLYLPYDVFDYAFEHHSEQLREKEEDSGNYPLHIAANMNARSYFRESVICKLMTKWPQAASETNAEGQLPLHIALCNKHPWTFNSIETLLSGHKESCTILDEKSCLYPFELAAVQCHDDIELNFQYQQHQVNGINHQLSTIYTLLRESPISLEHARQRQ